MEKILLYIKHRVVFIWRLIEWTNDLLYIITYKSKVDNNLSVLFRKFSHPQFIFRRLKLSDSDEIHRFIHSQNSSDLTYFQPHKFDQHSINKKLNQKSFIMMGVFDGEKMVGYFFLRMFFNKKCFVGRLIDYEYRGKGIGKIMNDIMYNTSWSSNFRCLSTISKENSAVMKAHSKNSSMKLIKELNNNYLLVEFKKE